MFVTRADARLHTLVFGSGPLSLLAVGGWIGPGDLWLDVFGHLPHWRCVTFDHRGTGATAHGPRPIGVEDQVDDLLGVADTLALQPCVLAAESAGVGIALQAALQAPGRFAGLVLVGGSWKRPAPGAFDGIAAAVRRDYDAFLRVFVDACLNDSDSPDLRRWGLQVLQRSGAGHALQSLECRAELGVEDRLESIDLPALVLHGSADRIAPPADSRELARRLPRATLHELPGAGHVPTVTRPAEVARLIDTRFCSTGLLPASVA